MATLKPKRRRYGEYAVLMIILVLALCGIIYFSNIVSYGIEFYASLLLATFGVYTILFVLYYLKFIQRSERNYMFLWGYIMAALGFALFFDLFNHNLFLNISIAVLIGALLGFISIRLT
jgi:uncharacterized membrane protein